MTTSAGKFLTSILKFSVGSWVSALIALISVPIVTRFFSPEEFGKINMFVMASGVIAAVVSLSMEHSYIRFFKEAKDEDARKKILTQCIAMMLCVCILFLVVNVFWGASLSYSLFGEINPLLIYVALPISVICSIILSYQSSFFRMKEQALGFTIISVLIVLANKLSMIGAAFYAPTYTIGVSFMALSLLVLVLAYLIFCPKSLSITFPILKKDELKPLLKYSLPLLPMTIIVLLNNFLIRFMLKDYVSYTALGVFVAAFTIANVLSLIQAGFNIYWPPFFFNNYNKEQALIKKIHSAISLIMVTFALLIILFSDLLFLILGDEYREGKAIFAFLLIYPVTYTIHVTTSGGIQLSKNTKYQLYSVLMSVICSIVACYILIPHIGIVGAAIANALSGVVFLLVGTYYGQKFYPSTEKFYRTLIALVILFIAAVASYYISGALPRNCVILGLLSILFLLYADTINQIKKIARQLLIR